MKVQLFDELTSVVGMYSEDIRDGSRFRGVARKAVLKKPVVLLKGGRTSKGAQATAMHTASLAMDDAVVGGALQQAGLIRKGSVMSLLGHS